RSSPIAVVSDRWGRWIKVGDSPRAKHGGQGKVWLVRDATLDGDELFALKELKYGRSPTSAGYRRFMREIQTVASLAHPNMVRVVDSRVPDGDDDEQPYYVMPWADRTLRNAKHLRFQVAAV